MVGPWRREAGVRPNVTDPAAGFGPSTIAAVRRSAATRPRRWLLAATMVLAVLVVAALATATDGTFADISATAQSVVSILVPFVGILLVSDLRGPDDSATLMPTLAAAALVGAALGA